MFLFVIQALRRWRQEDQARLGYKVRPYLTTPPKKKTHRGWRYRSRMCILFHGYKVAAVPPYAVSEFQAGKSLLL
jgi:hypothetical protein